jgi:hypothetical protein
MPPPTAPPIAKSPEVIPAALRPGTCCGHGPDRRYSPHACAHHRACPSSLACRPLFCGKVRRILQSLSHCDGRNRSRCRRKYTKAPDRPATDDDRSRRSQPGHDSSTTEARRSACGANDAKPGRRCGPAAHGAAHGGGSTTNLLARGIAMNDP